MSDKEMKEAFNSLHHIDYDEETDDYYIEHLEKIQKLKTERDKHVFEKKETEKALNNVFLASRNKKQVGHLMAPLIDEDENKKEKE